MDSLITAAARALAAGDPLIALKWIALRDDPPALALRGIAMAQLGDLVRARELLRSAARAFGPAETVARARCVVAEAEIALVSRDLRVPERTLADARKTLESHGDRLNAAHARYLEVRHLLLIGRIDAAERLLDGIDTESLPPALRTAHELAVAGIALRRLRASDAHAALGRAARAARIARIPALAAEVETAFQSLSVPAARWVSKTEERPLLLQEIEKLLESPALIVDGCRHVIRHRGKSISLTGRPVLFAIARALGEAWPEDVSRDALVARAFAAKSADESHRARLRVEVGRLRRLLRPAAGIGATRQGFVLQPAASQVIVLAQPVEDAHASLLALLADGESWASSALASALGTSQRTVQRSLDALAEAGKIRSFGRGRARRWFTPPLPGFATSLLLPPPLPID